MKSKYNIKKMPKLSISFFQKFLTILLSISVLLICTLLYLKKSGDVNFQTLTMAFLVGIIAQMIDGAIGMAYGITATTFLLTQGISPAIASSSIHIAEIFTTGASGLSHWRLNNINKKLFLSLVFPGVIGGIFGVIILSNIDGKIIKPWISVYLVIMGFYIIIKAIKKKVFVAKISAKKVGPLAFFGGTLDAIGGGGWGPVVTSSLLSSGHEPKKTIGSVNSAEFFITTTIGFSFVFLMGVNHPEIIAGLILGGIISAPFAAKITTKLSSKLLMTLVGFVIILLSLISILKNFGIF
jgi:uncharacterized membrane protein YfcA